MRCIVFDTETTGVEAKTDRITEIGCVEVIDFVPTGASFQSYFNPQRAMSEGARDVTGLTDEFLADKPLFADKVDEFLAFVGDAPLVAHNAGFDEGFINMELERLARPPFPSDRFIDTLAIARRKFPGAYNSLDALCKRFDISLDARDKHGALLDAQLLAAVYLELNGGRERRFDLSSPDAKADDAGPQTVETPRRAPRPTALASSVTPDEAAAHARFLATLSGGAQAWAAFGVTPVKADA